MQNKVERPGACADFWQPDSDLLLDAILIWLLLVPHRTILDVPETCADFWRFFGEHWGARLAAGQTRFGLFNSQDAP